MIRENLDWILVMLRYPDAAIEVRNHRQVSISPCHSFMWFMLSWGMTLHFVSELGINFSNVYCCSGKTLCDYLEALPREWISEDLIEALREKGVHLSPTV